MIDSIMKKKLNLELPIGLALFIGFIVSKIMPIFYPEIVPVNSKIKIFFEILFYVALAALLITSYRNSKKKK
ncbi:hypothetical protein [Clostridium cellulovorans]|uniref:Uncharacterized protein n=1 Tax=Clostridium cellulovorans (strain ATCC 35296 / DSM 3052 / OCM 3 / 743B) TaxID=573061 RepID=D9SSC1_CLOC7|nr:hypothetical protein [Clostridium cellulovorans]ADL50518.1 hypothetical protein Clocel_0747 [Clostridium cellulovorans 743B]